jgi:hypothetical protein
MGAAFLLPVYSLLECLFPGVPLAKNVEGATDTSAHKTRLHGHGLVRYPVLNSAVLRPTSFGFFKGFFVGHGANHENGVDTRQSVKLRHCGDRSRVKLRLLKGKLGFD